MVAGNAASGDGLGKIGGFYVGANGAGGTGGSAAGPVVGGIVGGLVFVALIVLVAKKTGGWEAVPHYKDAEGGASAPGKSDSSYTPPETI